MVTVLSIYNNTDTWRMHVARQTPNPPHGHRSHHKFDVHLFFPCNLCTYLPSYYCCYYFSFHKSLHFIRITRVQAVARIMPAQRFTVQG